MSKSNQADSNNKLVIYIGVGRIISGFKKQMGSNKTIKQRIGTETDGLISG
jgi:hypothetical protein